MLSSKINTKLFGQVKVLQTSEHFLLQSKLIPSQKKWAVPVKIFTIMRKSIGVSLFRTEAYKALQKNEINQPRNLDKS